MLNRLIEDEVLAKVIQNSTEGAAKSNVIVIIAALMLGFMFQTLWGALTTQQLILMVTNLSINLSPELRYTISLCQEYAQIDIMAPPYEYFNFNLPESDPYSEQLNENGYETKHYCYNMGGLITIFFWMSLTHIILMVIHNITVRFWKYRFMRKIGMMINQTP